MRAETENGNGISARSTGQLTTMESKMQRKDAAMRMHRNVHSCKPFRVTARKAVWNANIRFANNALVNLKRRGTTSLLDSETNVSSANTIVKKSSPLARNLSSF